ncbi:UTRA domain-containing protein [Aeromicrobium sp. UC242_57]|uniref:UTRA domain-containing protein n=1 Tax=Aeromicrobium sp. UC242_57 TaxID=3374624 RepID=UPI0037AC2DF5
MCWRSARFPPTRTSPASRLSTGADVWSLERLRWVDREPLALMHNFIPVDVVDLGSCRPLRDRPVRVPA